MSKSSIFLSVIFALTLMCGINGYKSLAFTLYETIIGVNTIDGAEWAENGAMLEKEPFILEMTNKSNDQFQNTNIKNKIISIQNALEYHSNNVLPIAKNTLININGGFQKLIGRSIFIDADVGNDVIMLDNGYLARLNTEDPALYEEHAKEVIRLDNFLAEQNIPLIFSVVPYKVEQVSIPVEHNGITNKEYIKNTIRDAGIPVIDWAQEMSKDGKEFFSMYYKTDHHWKAESGLWSAGIIADYCEKNYGFIYDKDVLNPDNFTYEVLENEFLGSQGKRVGTWVVGVDDFTIIHPNFKTSLASATLLNDGKWEKRLGTLEQTMYWEHHIAYRDYFGNNPEITPYSMYSNGDNPIQIIHNNNSINDKKILMVKHSFADVTIPFLALAYSEINVIDLRHHLRPENLYEYIDNYQPDLVLFLW